MGKGAYGEIVGYDDRLSEEMRTRLRLAVAFLALLELIRLGKARVEEAAEGLVIKGGSL